MNNKETLPTLKNNDLKHKSYIVFCLNPNKYAVDIQNIIEVINIPQINMPISTPKSIIGMFDYNGMMIKAVDICPLLGINTNPFSINNKLIITVINGNCFAIHTEYIENIIRIKQDELQPFPFEIEGSILKSVYRNNNIIINIIDITSLDKIIDKNKTIPSKVNYKELIPSDEKSVQSLSIRANLLKKNDDVFSFPFNLNTVNQYIMFTLGKHNYYLDLKYVKEFVTIDTENITPLPYTKSFIKGLLNIRGEFLIVFDLKNFLNNEAYEKNKNAKIIVVEGKDFNIAILVDEIKYIKNLKQFQTVISDSTYSKYILSEFEEDNILYSIINFEKILNDENLYININ